MIIFKDTNNSISNSKEHTDSPRSDVAIEIHKISLLDTPNQILIRGKDLTGHVHDTLKHFCETKEDNGNCWLFLMSLDKVGKEKGLRNSNSLLKHFINDLKASMSALKETPCLL